VNDHTTPVLQSDTLAKLAPALVKAQATMGVALKDSTNPHFRSKYADLTSIITASRDALTENGLAVLQRSHPNDKGVHLETVILHASGEWISDGGLFLPASKLDPQGFGSAITYCRRYAYAAMLGIVQDDDDGNAASQPRPVVKQTAAPAPAPKPAPEKTAAEQLADLFDATPATTPTSAVGGDTGANADAYTFKFGKNKGKALAEVESSYLDWLLRQPAREGYEEEHAAQHAMFRRELARREAVGA
jgi:hypothetical protein